MAEEELYTEVVKLMGTTITVKTGPGYYLPAAELAHRACARLKQLEHIFSANDESAELMAINKAAGDHPVKVDPLLYALVDRGRARSLYPGGHLNIAIGPLVKLWHIGFEDAHVPTAAQIKERLALTNPRKIVLDPEESTVFLTDPGMEIDLGCLAKGESADLILADLKGAGVKSALVNLGGNVATLGFHPSGRPWRVSLQDPTKPRGTGLARLELVDQSVVTSGIYERNLQVNGKTYHHIFDPQTGYPQETDLASLSIITPKSVDGEVWTTMLFGKPLATIKAVVANLPHTSGVAVTKRGEVCFL